jgi:hypothetical protein
MAMTYILHYHFLLFTLSSLFTLQAPWPRILISSEGNAARNTYTYRLATGLLGIQGSEFSTYFKEV